MSSVPYLESLIVVPQMPAFETRPAFRLALVPEDPATEKRRESTKVLATLGVGLAGTIAWLFTKEIPDLGGFIDEMESDEKKARGIAYSLGATVADVNWIAALLLSLGTARIEEFLEKWKVSERLASTDIQRWANVIGPPQPNDNWKDAIQRGPFPFLLVPPSIWQQMGADQASRRFRMLASFGGA